MRIKALLIVDVQNDFCPGGALAVPEGDQVVPVLNRYLEIFADKGLPVLASRDWHPTVTKHFKDYGGTWPAHCVQDTAGAAFPPALKLPRDVVIISKGMDPGEDSYSAFQGVDHAGRPLATVLAELKVKELFVGGLATDYCVKASCLDARKHGFTVYLLTDAVRAVNINPHDGEEAVAGIVRQAGRKTDLAQVKRLLERERPGAR